MCQRSVVVLAATRRANHCINRIGLKQIDHCSQSTQSKWAQEPITALTEQGLSELSITAN